MESESSNKEKRPPLQRSPRFCVPPRQRSLTFVPTLSVANLQTLTTDRPHTVRLQRFKSSSRLNSVKNLFTLKKKTKKKVYKTKSVDTVSTTNNFDLILPKYHLYHLYHRYPIVLRDVIKSLYESLDRDAVSVCIYLEAKGWKPIVLTALPA